MFYIMPSGVYSIKNRVNGKMYIGSAVDITIRWYKHVSELKLNKHHSRKLQNAWNKYGEGCFDFSVVEIVEDRNNLLNREQYFIDLFQVAGDAGYNILPNARNAIGVKRTAETRAKISAVQKGKPRSPESVAKSVAGRTGKPRPQESRDKMSASMKAIHANRRLENGYVPPPEPKRPVAWREKLRAANVGKLRSEESKANMRAGWERRRERLAAEKVAS